MEILICASTLIGENDQDSITAANQSGCSDSECINAGCIRNGCQLVAGTETVGNNQGSAGVK